MSYIWNTAMFCEKKTFFLHLIFFYFANAQYTLAVCWHDPKKEQSEMFETGVPNVTTYLSLRTGEEELLLSSIAFQIM